MPEVTPAAKIAALRAKLTDAKTETECPDCGGEGDLGHAPDGRLVSCETCGGHEDRLGCGYNDPQKAALLDALLKHCDAHEQAEATDTAGWPDGALCQHDGTLRYMRTLTDALLAALGAK